MPGRTVVRCAHRTWLPRSLLCLALALPTGSSPVRAQLTGGQLAGSQLAANPAAPPPLTVEQIGAQLQHTSDLRALALRSYESRRVMTLSYKGKLADKLASETVQMTYTAPGSKQFVILSANGSPLLRDSVFQRAMDSEQEAAGRTDIHMTPANYEMKLLGSERLPEGECYVLSVTPRHNNRFTYRGKIWVQSTDFAIVRIDAEPVETPSFWVKNGLFRTEYSKVGDFWFPTRMISNSHIRLGGDATLTIQYGPYHILSTNPTPTSPSPRAME